MGVSLSRLRIRRSHNNPVTNEQSKSISAKNDKESKPMKTPRTASNPVEFALRTLSSASRGITGAAALIGIIEPLRDITSRIDPTSVNAQGLIQLATRIERLTFIVEEMAESNPDGVQSIVRALQQELALMTTDLKAASQRSKLNQFFHNTENASALGKHNMVLAQMIADFTLVGVHEVLKSLRELERSKLQNPSSPPTMMGDITGGVGVAGGQGHAGGEGGEGGGPRLEMDPDKRYQIGNVSGGTGGTGGVGVEVGGKGGTGKGPVISMRRSRVLEF
ncbi:hypothetical protein K438DRAFT_1990849 [Mycena galopus ATCC 62051]|nr:hypothetical protein K438DRAFT_1990849 [Mycena galopus ATCC 62051]